MKLKALYKFDLGKNIYNNCIALGKFDGEKFSISYATQGGKIIIYSPNDKQENNVYSKKGVSNQGQKEITLNLNKEINSLIYGKGEIGSNKSYLFIGSPSSLICFDMLENKTLFNKEIDDGVYCIASGIFSLYPKPLIMVGGNCSLQGFDIQGEEQFWTVTGGNTLSIVLNDVDDDSLNEVIVGTDDYNISIVKREQTVLQINENNKVIFLHSISNNRFIYALENGVLGLYKRGKKVWCLKDNGKVNSALVCDINRDNQLEVIVGYSTGKLKILIEENGENLHEIEFSSSICKLFWENFSGSKNNSTSSQTQSDNNQLIVSLSSGEICGFDFDEENFFEKIDALKEESIKLQRLQNEKQAIIAQLQKITIEISNIKKVNMSREDNSLSESLDVIIDLKSNNEDKCADLIISTTDQLIKIKQVIIYSEKLYEGGSYVQEATSDSNQMIIQITNKKDMKINLHIKVLVGLSLYNSDFQVFEFSKVIPKYCFYILLRDIEKDYNSEIQNGVIFNVNIRRDRLLNWIQDNFNITLETLSMFIAGENYHIRFLSLRTDKVLKIFMKENEIQILTDEIELAGNIFQDMCAYFNCKDVNSVLNYPESIGQLEKCINRIKKLDLLRNKTNINMTEIISQIKEYFIRAEDARLIQNNQTFLSYFKRINIKNQEILDEYKNRSIIYNELIVDLKTMNNLIYSFANLKFGANRFKVISDTSKCIKDKDYTTLLKVVHGN